LNTVNPMISAPAQPISFSKHENAIKFFDNPFMASTSQPPGLFPTNSESSYNQNQNNRRTKKPVRISWLSINYNKYIFEYKFIEWLLLERFLLILLNERCCNYNKLPNFKHII
jgi:hypothetical protein